ncbi:YdcF family protein [Pseudomonas kribbensis]|uniref:YdcF family protein n=1 Tax=Pseudomonas kribbensis TaxID=1628086 RepID=A0A345RK42_9PSED|nr:YdcF family protein [Pseudomonas kribbensis]AXI59658.1 YdcF family protein [Pseudomonas kribbensis]
MTPTLRHATVLWNFLGAGRQHNDCELIVVCGSYDLRVCDYACQLLKKGVAPHLLFTGNTGNWTKHLWERTEADIFAQRAMIQGVSPDQFTLESRATNFAENIAFARELFPDVRRATFLTKPNSIRRVALTLPVQWPGLEAWVDAPSFGFPGEVSNLIGVLGLIDEMVGDIHRIMVYPSLGFQAEQVIPEEVEAAWCYLIEQGFDHHLIKGRH